MLKRRTKKNLLLISLLLHLIVIIFFTFNAFKTTQRPVFIKPTKKQAEELRRQAQLRPKRSDEGTQVVFDDRTILPSDPTKTPKPALAKVEQKEIEKEPIQEEPTKKIAKREVTKPAEKIEKKKELPKTQTLKKRKLIAQAKPHFPEKKPPEETKKVTEEKIEPPKPLTQEDLKKLALANMLKEQHKKTSPRQATPAPAKPKKSLLSLMKSYIDSENGNSCIIREGENRNPSIEELKYICYEKQIDTQITTAWKIFRAGKPSIPNGSAYFDFVINEDGSLDKLLLTNSFGDPLFAKIALEVIKNATPFPPIPKHFGMKKYRPKGLRTKL